MHQHNNFNQITVCGFRFERGLILVWSFLHSPMVMPFLHSPDLSTTRVGGPKRFQGELPLTWGFLTAPLHQQLGSGGPKRFQGELLLMWGFLHSPTSSIAGVGSPKDCKRDTMRPPL